MNMYKALRIGAIILIPLVKASLADMYTSGLMILNICSSPSDATFNKQPTASHVGLLTRKKNVLITEILRNSHPRACNFLWQIDTLLLVMPGPLTSLDHRGKIQV